MRSLEIENEALKQEVERLRAELTRHVATGGSGAAAQGCRSDSSSKGGPAAAVATAVPYVAVGQPPLGPAATGVPVAAPASNLPIGFGAAGEGLDVGN